MKITKKLLPGFSAYLGKEPPATEVPDDLPPIPMLYSLWGCRGSGKSVAATTLLRKYREANLMQRLFVITPTFTSNKHLLDDLVNSEDVYNECTQASLDTVLQAVQDEADSWRRYKEHKLVWEAYHAQKKSYIAGKRKEIDADILLGVTDAGLADITVFPEYKYTCNGSNHPQMWLFLDDCQNSALFNPSSKIKNNLSNVLIKHRHLSGRFGLNIVIALQNFKAQGGVLSKAMRANMTCMSLFGYRDEKLLKGIQEELGRDIDAETFQAIYGYATSGEKWRYLFIEFSPTRFRRCLEEILTIDAVTDASAIANNAE